MLGIDKFKGWFVTPDLREKSGGCSMSLISSDRVNMVLGAIVPILIAFLLMVPICLLFTLDFASKFKLIVTLLSVFLFHALISVCSHSRPTEPAASTAA